MIAPREHRLIASGMLMLLIPIAGAMIWISAHRYQVYPGGGGNRPDWVLSDDAAIIIREITVGLPFQSVRRQFDAYDMRTNRKVWTWVPEHSDTSILSVSDDGTKLCVRSGGLYFVHGFAPPHKRLRELPLTWDDELPSIVRWVDDDSKVIYGTGGAAFRVLDLESGIDEELQGSTETYPFIGYWVSDDWYLTVSNSFNPQIPQNVYRRNGDRLELQEHLSEFNDDRGFVFRGGTRFYLFGMGAMTDLETGDRIELEEPEGEGYYLARFSDDLTYYHIDEQDRAIGATLVDSVDGSAGRFIEFDKVFDQHTFHIHRESRFFHLANAGTVASSDLNGRVIAVDESPSRRWFRWTLASIATTVLWWIAWTLLLRRRDRSSKAAYDVAILHGIVLVASGTRLYSGSYDFQPAQGEAVFFFAATTSGVALLLFWFIYGTNDWRRRCTQAILVTASVLAVYRWLWGGQGGWYMGIMLPAFAVTSLLAFMVLRLASFRVHHGLAPGSTTGWQGRTVGIKQMIVWVIAFAALFGVARHCGLIQAPLQDIQVLASQGAAAAFLASLVVISSLWIRNWLISLTVSIVVTGITIWTTNQLLGAPPTWKGGLMFHPSGSFVFLFALQSVLLLASCFAIRRNGYRLEPNQRPSISS